VYRDAVQLVIDEMWGLDTVPSTKHLHRMFYEKLRKYGFRAHHAKQIYAYAQSIVESARGNSGRKLILKKLTARIDKYDYRLDLDTTTLVLKLHDNHEVKLKLLVPRERVEKFKEWSNYELVVKYDGERFWVSVYFKIWIERIQRRHPKSWRYIKRVKRAIERHGERIRNISWDYAHKIGI